MGRRWKIWNSKSHQKSKLRLKSRIDSLKRTTKFKWKFRIRNSKIRTKLFWKKWFMIDLLQN